MYLGIDEKGLARAATFLIRENDSVYDIGAHIGYTSILFAQLVGPGGSVQAFELMPSTAEVLKKSLALNGLAQCYVHVIGLGSEERKITLARGLTFMGSLYDSVSGGSGAIGEECLVTRLDDYRMDNHLPPPQFVKMDIEFAEVEALRGAQHTLMEAESILLIEFHSLALLKEGRKWLADLGYEIRLLSGEQLTHSYVESLTYFHQTVMSYKPQCKWHQERLSLFL